MIISLFGITVTGDGPKEQLRQAAMIEAARLAFFPLEPTPEQVIEWAWSATRTERDRLLAASDWTQAADTPLTPAQRALWRQYRQALRDVPQRYSNPAGVAWPAPPTEIQLQQAKLAENRPAFIDDMTVKGSDL